MHDLLIALIGPVIFFLGILWFLYEVTKPPEKSLSYRKEPELKPFAPKTKPHVRGKWPATPRVNDSLLIYKRPTVVDGSTASNADGFHSGIAGAHRSATKDDRPLTSKRH